MGIKEQLRYFLIETGVLPENIEISNICTFENKECCSYRKYNKDAGRMYSMLGLILLSLEMTS